MMELVVEALEIRRIDVTSGREGKRDLEAQRDDLRRRTAMKREYSTFKNNNSCRPSEFPGLYNCRHECRQVIFPYSENRP